MHRHQVACKHYRAAALLLADHAQASKCHCCSLQPDSDKPCLRCSRTILLLLLLTAALLMCCTRTCPALRHLCKVAAGAGRPLAGQRGAAGGGSTQTPNLGPNCPCSGVATTWTWQCMPTASCRGSQGQAHLFTKTHRTSRLRVALC